MSRRPSPTSQLVFTTARAIAHDNAQTRGSADRRWFVTCVALLLAVSAVLCSGCSLSDYRLRADREAQRLIREKANHPQWMLPRTDISIDPSSRMFDPFAADCPPMPPDDPYSHQLMHCVDNKPNYPHWHKNGDTVHVENPNWRDYLPLDERGVLILDLSTAMHLALKNSTDYQEEFEDLYLSALDVSAERFRFDAQFFGGSNAFYQTSGRDSGRPRSRLSVDSDLVVRKAFITGGELVAGFANSLVWDFHGPNTNSVFSILDFSLLQPLLRGAGRDRVLTRLTLAERQLLANVRQMERFRRGFYMEIATGEGGTFGARRIGGLFGGSGLEGFTGVGGGFGTVGGFFAGAGGADAAAAALQVGGFLGLLQAQQNIKNQRSNIAGLRSNAYQFQQTLRENLRTLPDDPTELVRNRLQVAQARQTLYDQEFALASAHAQYQSRVDDFKVELGLPPDLCVEIADPLLDQFNLLDPRIISTQDAFANLSQVVGSVNEQLLAAIQYKEVDGTRVPTIAWTDETAENLRRIERHLARIQMLHEELSSGILPIVSDDVEHLKTALPDRRDTLARLRAKYPEVLDRELELSIACQTRLPVDIDPYILDVSRLNNLDQELGTELARLEEQLSAYRNTIEQIGQALTRFLQSGPTMNPADLQREMEQQVVFAVPSLLAQLSSDLLDLSLVQARARADSIDLIPVNLPMQQAVCIAALNRRDWMNARASLVDTWRAIPFVANDLEGVLDVLVEGDIGTVGDNPFDFRSTTGTLRMGLQFDAPLTRLLERNNYRQVLIDYQQARRNYYQFVDRVTQGLRNTIRTLDLNELNFETRRVAVLSAIQQIVLNDEIQTLNEERGQAQGVTAARDIVQALSDLQAAQDDFMGVWLTYEVNRRFLDYDLGTMQLDENGIWMDPGAITAGAAPYVCEPNCLPLLTPNVSQWFAAAEVASPNEPTVASDREGAIESAEEQAEIQIPLPN